MKYLPAKSDAIETFFLATFYGTFLFCFLLFLGKTGLATVVPGAETLERWDAPIYHRVSEIGYFYNGQNDNNTAVYILFPWVWKLLHVGVIGMSLFNLVFFAIGFTIITRIYPVPHTEKILWLTTPSLYFMFVPYTEALFCLLSAISFYGIAKNIKWLTWIGLFLVSLTRATAVFLVPALLIMALISQNRKDAGRSFLGYLINYALPTLAGLATFVIIQYIYTKQWFPYFKIQATNLGHSFSWPTLPFDNVYGDTQVTWLSALTMFPCVIALGILCKKIVAWLKNATMEQDKIWLLTLGYLPIILFTMIFCNPKWGYGHTNLLGIHRYVFCSPYIFVFFYKMTSIRQYAWKHFVAILLICNAIWLTMGSYLHIQFLLFYNFLTLLVIGYMLHANKKAWVTPLLCCVNFLLQLSLFQDYLLGHFTD